MNGSNEEILAELFRSLYDHVERRVKDYVWDDTRTCTFCPTEYGLEASRIISSILGRIRKIDNLVIKNAQIEELQRTISDFHEVVY